MHRVFRSLPLWPLAIFSAQALAQSQAEVYGNLDVSVVKRSGEEVQLDRGYNNWLGFRGQEDLGGGVSAVFNLQTRLKPDTGAQERSGTFWQGETTLGLKSKTLGTLRLGRALSPLWQNVWAYEPWWNSAFNASLASYQTAGYTSDALDVAADGTLRDFANFSRISNGVFYRSPALAGLTIDLAAEVQRDAAAPARVMGTSLNYARGPLSTMLSYERNAVKDDVYFAGAAYKFGASTLMGSYAWHDPQAGERVRSFVVAGTHALGLDAIRAGYGRNLETDNDKLSLGYVHGLSKRTKLYADLWREDAGASDKNGVALGVNHTF